MPTIFFKTHNFTTFTSPLTCSPQMCTAHTHIHIPVLWKHIVYCVSVINCHSDWPQSHIPKRISHIGHTHIRTPNIIANWAIDVGKEAEKREGGRQRQQPKTHKVIKKTHETQIAAYLPFLPSIHSFRLSPNFALFCLLNHRNRSITSI